jgi:hypothetical protein
MGDFTVNVRQKPMDFNRWQLELYMYIHHYVQLFFVSLGNPQHSL